MRQSLAPDIAAVMPLAVATGLFRSVMSVFAPDGILSSTGAPSGTFVAVGGLQSLACQDAPDAVDRYNLTSKEVRNQYENASMELRHMLLTKYYPALSPTTNWGDVGWRANVDGITYDILAAESDSQRTQTRLRLRKVTI